MNEIAYWLLRALMKALGSLPLRFNYAVGSFVAWCLRVTHYRYDVVLTNIARSFPRMTYGEVRQTARGFYTYLGRVVAESVWFGACPRDGRRFRESGICRFSNIEEINRLHRISPSVMLLNAHVCNWELIGGFMHFGPIGAEKSFSEAQAKVSYKQMRSRVWDRIMKDNRTALIAGEDRYGNLLESSSLVKYIAGHHDEHLLFHMIADQYPYKGAGGMDIEFMHQPTKTMTAAGRLAGKYGMAVAYLGVRCVSRGHYEYTVHTIADDASKLSLEEIYDKFYDLVRQDIEADPCSYLWSHKRWKKR